MLRQTRLHRGGDRQLNRAIHIIALGRAAWDPATRVYLQRKQTEGKTKREAIRCLKRHIAREIYNLLYNSATVNADQLAIPPRPAPRHPVDHTTVAAAPARCLT